MRHLLLAAAILWLAACDAAQQQEPPDPPVTTTTALFDLSEEIDDLFALPFPNDLRRRADGAIELGPKFHDRTELLQRYFDLVASGRFGFASNAAIYFRFSGPIDEKALPQSPTESLQASASVQLVDVDDRSAARGQRVPITCRFIEAGGKYMGPNALALQPVDGLTLRPGTLYAALVTDGLVDRDGVAVAASASFTALLAEQPSGSNASAHAVYKPLRDYLKAEGVTGVVSAALFTTGDHVALLGKLREVVAARAAPTATDLVVAGETELYYEIQGRYPAPNFQQGTVPFLRASDGGAIDLDSQGIPLVAREESLRFALTLPKGQMPAGGWPIVLYAHGTGGDYRSFIRQGIAAGLASIKDSSGGEVARAAVVGIDQSLHGDRVPQGTDPTMAFLNIRNPTASVFNVLQGAADNFSLLRLVKGLQLTTVARSDSTAPLVFDKAAKLDASQLAFMGHSQGTITGIPFVASEPEVVAAVFSGAGGIGRLTLLLRDTPFDFAGLASMAAGETIDATHPVTTLIQQLLEPSDPINYAPLLLREVAAGGQPKHVFLAQGIIDQEVPAPTIHALAVAAGLPPVGPELDEVAGRELVGLEPVALPASGNLQVGDRKITGGLRQYRGLLSDSGSCSDDDACSSDQYCDEQEQRCRGDGHYVVFRRDDARHQVEVFLGTLFRDGLPAFVE